MIFVPLKNSIIRSITTIVKIIDQILYILLIWFSLRFIIKNLNEVIKNIIKINLITLGADKPKLFENKRLITKDIKKKLIVGKFYFDF